MPKVVKTDARQLHAFQQGLVSSAKLAGPLWFATSVRKCPLACRQPGREKKFPMVSENTDRDFWQFDVPATLLGLRLPDNDFYTDLLNLSQPANAGRD